MINVFITIFIAVIIGVSLIGPIAEQTMGAASSTNASGSTCTSYTQGGCGTANQGAQLYIASSWGATILKMVPGFFVLIILGVVVAGLYSVFRQAGIV